MPDNETQTVTSATTRRNKGVRYEMYFPVEMDKELREMKERTGNSVASYIRNAIRAALDRENSQAGNQ